MDARTVIKYFGSRAAVADALGVTVSLVGQWAQGAPIPLRQRARIVIASNGNVPLTAAEHRELSDEARLFRRAADIARKGG